MKENICSCLPACIVISHMCEPSRCTTRCTIQMYSRCIHDLSLYSACPTPSAVLSALTFTLAQCLARLELHVSKGQFRVHRHPSPLYSFLDYQRHLVCLQVAHHLFVFIQMYSTSRCIAFVAAHLLLLIQMYSTSRCIASVAAQ